MWETSSLVQRFPFKALAEEFKHQLNCRATNQITWRRCEQFRERRLGYFENVSDQVGNPQNDDPLQGHLNNDKNSRAEEASRYLNDELDVDLDDIILFENIDNEIFTLLPFDGSSISSPLEGEAQTSMNSWNVNDFEEPHEAQNFESLSFPSADEEAPLRRSSRLRKVTSKLTDPTN